MTPTALTAYDLARHLRDIAAGMNAANNQGLLREAARRLERYQELFKWSNENCIDCADGRIPRHPQPLPSPETEAKP